MVITVSEFYGICVLMLFLELDFELCKSLKYITGSLTFFGSNGVHTAGKGFKSQASEELQLAACILDELLT